MATLEDFINTLELIADVHNFEDHHGERTALLAVEIGKRLDELNEDQLLSLQYAARIHDLGRVGIDNHIVSKSSRLTKSQRAAMQEHSQIGFDLLSKSNLPPEITYAVLYHHEHWDGSGYPKGLRGQSIPLFARIVCIADHYDAVLSRRPYHDARSDDAALEEMNQSIQWFDPSLYSVFLNVLRERRYKL